MSLNQSRPERTDSVQYRKTGRSGFNQQRSFSGGSGGGSKGGGVGGGGGSSAPPIFNQSRSFKKFNNNNAQGSQARVSGPAVNTDSNNQTAARNIENGAHPQQPPTGVSSIPVTSAVRQADVSMSKTTRTVPRAPPSGIPVTSSETPTPATPANASGEASRPVTLQFGTISPNFVNGMHIPARTSSAPPNIDEQKRDQARHEAARTANLPTHSIPKQQLPKMDVGTVSPSSAVESHSMSKLKRDGPVPAVPPGAQIPKPSVQSMPAMPVPISFHQPQVSLPFGGPTPQIQSQGALPMHMPVPLPIGNPQQPMFVPGLQSHPMQSHGLIHQGQGFNFSAPMSPQLGNMGINMSPQFPQQQAGKYGGRRVKITHPDTREELRFDGSSGPRSHPNMPPQSQPVPSFQHPQPVNHYANSYNFSSVSFPAPGSHPVGSTHINSGPQPRFNNQVTVKPAVHSHGDKDMTSSTSAPTGMMVDSSIRLKQNGEGSIHPQKDIESSHSLPHSRPVLGPSSAPMIVASTESVGDAVSNSKDGLIPNSLSIQLEATPYQDHASGQKQESSGQTCLINTEQKTAVDVGCSVTEEEAGGRSTTSASQPSEAVCVEDKLTAPTVISEVMENGKESLSGGVKIGGSKHSEPEILPEVQGNTMVQGVVSSPGTENLGPPESSSLEPMKDIGQVQDTFNLKVRASSNKITCNGIPALGNLEGDNHEVASTFIPVDKDTEPCPSMIGSTTEDDKISTFDSAASKPEDIDGDNTSVLDLSSEDNLKYEEEASENLSSDFFAQSSDAKEKLLLQTNTAKGAVPKGKKKRKELIKRANAAGATSDLYMAYKGPEENKENMTSIASAETTLSDSLRQVSLDSDQDVAIPTEKGEIKVEPDDWEDAADISTPKLVPPQNGNPVDENYTNDVESEGAMTKKYSRDFLLKFSEQFTDLPDGFEITSDIAQAVMGSSANASRESSTSSGRVNDRGSGSRPERRGSGMGDEDKWSKVPGPLVTERETRLDIGVAGHAMGYRPGPGGNYGVLRTPRAQMPVQYPGGPLISGVMQSLGPHGGLQRNNSDSERWQRATNFQKGLMPSPQTPQTPLQMMHRAERKYQVGNITDEEQAKQRQLKAILNKLTPQNFEKLFEQVKQVNIDNAITLTGVISQIFDKALMEPTFCEMYANFCHYLAAELPDLSVENERITFKRLLLNKCQEEFERGEREQEEANKAEEGEVKQSEGEREEKRLKARRRMLGNIRLIGELYKKRMLTERIMHECIKKLLGGPGQIPDEEDLEALCKLMSTIGEMIDHLKAKDYIDVYFDMMAKLSTNMKLSSRVRFMLLDAIDLRKNKWQQRRKVEGPKKIDEVHRDAAQERQAQASRLARSPSMGNSVRRGQPIEFAPRGSNVFSSPGSHIVGLRSVPPQLRGFGGTQDARFEERHPMENRILSIPLPQRSDDLITLGPQGGLGKGMSYRGQPLAPSSSLSDMPSPGDSRRMVTGLNGFSAMPERSAYTSREDLIPRYQPDRFSSQSTYDQTVVQDRTANYGNNDGRNTDRSLDRTLPTAPPVRATLPTLSHPASSGDVWPEERLRDMSMAAIKEFYSAKDENEVVLCIKELNAPTYYPTMVSLWVTDSFERKDLERDLLAKLLVNLVKSRDETINQDQLTRGFEFVLETLEDAVNDAPRAAEFLGHLFAKVVSENVISLAEIGKLIYEGGEEQGRLVEVGLAAEVLGSILESIQSEKGDTILAEIRTGSNLQFQNFRPPGSNKSWRIDKFI